MNAIDELNSALQQLTQDVVAPEIRFYYDPVTKVGTQLNGDSDSGGAYVIITHDEYLTMAIDVASKFYLSKSGKVKRIPLAKGMQKLLEYADGGRYRTVKDCMVFLDHTGPDAYNLREIDYD